TPVPFLASLRRPTVLTHPPWVLDASPDFCTSPPNHPCRDPRRPARNGRAGLRPDAGGRLPAPESAGHLRLPDVWGHGPRADGGIDRQLLRVSLPLHHRHSSRREPERSGRVPDEAVFPPGHGHVPGHG